MAHRRVEVGERVRLRYGRHDGKLGVVTAHERRVKLKRLRNGQKEKVTLLTYVVELDGVGPRRVPGSYLELI